MGEDDVQEVDVDAASAEQVSDDGDDAEVSGENDGGDEKARYLLIWFSMDAIIPDRLVPIRRKIEDQIKEPRESVEIDVWIESPGGDAHTAYKLALMLRAVAGTVRTVVPDYAKSAATLLSLVGEKIYMAPGAELGPLDAQMPDEGSLLGQISALSIARAADEVAKDAVELAGSGGARLLAQTGLKREQTLEAMLRFSASFSEPLVRQLDPRLVHDAKQTLKVTKRYAERLLVETLSRNKASEIAARLVENFPTHGFVISYDEAREMGLPVEPIKEYDLYEYMKYLHRKTEDGDSVIVLIPVKEILGEEDDDELEDEKDDGEGSRVGESDSDETTMHD